MSKITKLLPYTIHQIQLSPYIDPVPETFLST